MPSAPTTSLDLTAPDVVADPYPYFAEERAAHPVAWHEQSGTLAGVRPRHRERRPARPPAGRLWRDKEPADVPRAVQPPAPQPDDGERAARAHPAAPTGRGGVRPRVTSSGCGRGSRELARELLDAGGPGRLRRGRRLRRAAAGPGHRRAARRPGVVRRRPAGLVAGDREDVRGRRRRRRSSTRRCRPPASSPGSSASWSPSARARPPDDLISDLVDHRADRGRGGGARRCCCSTPATRRRSTCSATGWSRCCGAGCGPAPDVAACVEEMLRFDSALQLFERTATEDVEVGDVMVERGPEDRGAARGRPTATRRSSTRPTSSGVDREPNPHVAFGVGRALLPRRPAGADGAGGVAGRALGDVPGPGAGGRAGEPGDVRAAGLP